MNELDLAMKDAMGTIAECAGVSSVDAQIVTTIYVTTHLSSPNTSFRDRKRVYECERKLRRKHQGVRFDFRLTWGDDSATLPDALRSQGESK
jgi:hypothetical protein